MARARIMRINATIGSLILSSLIRYKIVQAVRHGRFYYVARYNVNKGTIRRYIKRINGV